MPQTPSTAKERIEAIKELRLSGKTLKSPFAKHLLNETIFGVEQELKTDAEELRELVASASTAAIQTLLRENAAAIDTALADETGAAGDDEGVDAAKAAPSKKNFDGPALAPSAPPLSTTPADKPMKTAYRSSSVKAAPPMEKPPGGFDPEGWPVASSDGLPPECWRSSHLPARQVPRCPYYSKAARVLLDQRKPVILTHSPLVTTATGKWRLDYLRGNLRDVACTVYASKTRHFRYWDDDKNNAGYVHSEEERTERLTMSIDDFCDKLRSKPSDKVAEGGEGSGATGDADDERMRYYLQTALVEGVGSEMTSDFKGFDWDALLALQRRLGWNDLSSNLLLVGERGNTTPAHYDEQQNIFAQLDGTKRCVLFSPDDFRCLYPFPLHHPCDRQSQVDLYAPDLARFPRFAEARPFEAVLEPGELLYIPQYWWHHIENLTDECVSLNFWFKDQQKPQKLVLPLSGHQHLAMRRNIEKLVANKLGPKQTQAALSCLAAAKEDEHAELTQLRKEVSALLGHVMQPEEVDPWLAELTSGRFEGMMQTIDVGDGESLV